VLTNGHRVRYVLNYSSGAGHYATGAAAQDLLTGVIHSRGEEISLAPWGVAILEDSGA